MGRIKHPHLMSPLPQNRRQRLDSERRESHHFDSSVGGFRAPQVLGQQAAKIIITDVNEEYIHSLFFPDFQPAKRHGGRHCTLIMGQWYEMPRRNTMGCLPYTQFEPKTNNGIGFAIIEPING
jgi:hypothetical protein